MADRSKPALPVLLVQVVDLLAVVRAHGAVVADVHPVVARAAVEHGAALRVRLDDVVAGAGEHRVGARAAEADRVVAVPAEDAVALRAALEEVVAVPAEDLVGGAAAVRRVVAGARVDLVGAERGAVVEAVAPQDVVTGVAEQRVRAGAAEQVVVAFGAAQRAAVPRVRGPGDALGRVGRLRLLDDVLAVADVAAADVGRVGDPASAVVRVDVDRVVAGTAVDGPDGAAVVDPHGVVALTRTDAVGPGV